MVFSKAGVGADSRDAFGPCVVERAKIMGVDPECYTVHVITTETNRDIPDVKFAVPTLHADEYGGSGLNFMPQAGDMCYLFTPADGTGSFVLGFIYVGKTEEVTNIGGKLTEQLTYRGSRPRLEPGDISLTTPDENFVIVRRGGVVQVGATSMAQTIYLPLENLIRHYFAKYQSFSPIGEIVWDHAAVTTEDFPMPGKGEPSKADIPTMVKFSCREKIQDKKMSVEFRMGRLNKDMLDASLDSNLVNAGKAQTVEVVGNPADVDKGKEIELDSSVKLDAGDDGEIKHLFTSQKTRGGLGLKPDHKESPGLMSVIISPEDGDDYPVKYTFQIDREGNNFIRSASHVHMEVEKGCFISTSQEEGFRVSTRDSPGKTAKCANDKKRWIELNKDFRAHVKEALVEILSDLNINIKTVGGNITMTCTTGNFTVDAKNVVIKSSTNIQLDAASTIELGKGAKKSVLAMVAADLTALQDHQHTYMTSAGIPATTSPTVPAKAGLPANVTTDSTSPKVMVP